MRNRYLDSRIFPRVHSLFKDRFMAIPRRSFSPGGSRNRALMESACRKYALSIFDEGFANVIGSNYFLKMDAAHQLKRVESTCISFV